MIDLHLIDERCELVGHLLNNFAKELDFTNGFMRCIYQSFVAWHAWLENRLTRAMQFALAADAELNQSKPTNIIKVRSRFILAQIYASQGRYAEAIRYSALVRHNSVLQFNQKWFFLSWLASAQFALERKQPRRCQVLLQRALALGREQDIVHFPFFKVHVIAQLCAEALQADIEVDYVQSLIRLRRLIPPKDSLNLDCWPWPLKIYCFGAFKLIKDDAPIQFARKAPKKPLQLLKALIALGGVNVSEQRLIDMLWPDEEADKAHNAFSTNLNRLRKLIGNELITLIEGSLSLNPQQCWLDVWSFQHLVREAEQAQQHDDWQRFEQSAQNLQSLYQDHFLADDVDEFWAITLRERLRQQYLRITVALANGWYARGAWRSALNAYQQGLEVENLSEEFYQGQMRSYQQLGLKAEALECYHRCQRILSLSLGLEPSKETQKIYQDIVNC